MQASEAEIRRIAQEAAHQAVRETLVALGINIADEDAVISAQVDFAFLRRQRRGAEEIARWTRRGVVGAGVSGLLWLLWEGLQVALRAKGG